MKRVVTLLVALSLCLGLTGCSGLEYTKASRLYKKGEYAQALEIYQSLGNYADSAKMVQIAAQKADYVAAEAYFAAGEYTLALPLYEGLGMYSDSPLKAIQCRYEQGKICLAREEYDQAESWLVSIGNYEDALDLVNQARWNWLSQARRTHVISQQEGDFRALSVSPQEDGSLHVLYESDGLLLGLPMEIQFTLTLSRNAHQADYTVRYRSVTDTVVEETAAGKAEPATFTGTPVMTVDTFCQTVTDEIGAVQMIHDTAKAIMIRMIMSDAAAQTAQQMQTLLDKAGIRATAADFGF